MPWFCLRSRPKHEHIAAAHLRLIDGVEACCPRVRLQRMTRKGPAWFTEALFPGYLFARFDPVYQRKAVHYCQGVAGIVSFGGQLAIVPEDAIAELRTCVGPGEIRVIPPEIREGDNVVVSRGVFQGLHTLVTQAAPAAQRVRILLEFLGECREAEVSKASLMRESRHLLASDPALFRTAADPGDFHRSL